MSFFIRKGGGRKNDLSSGGGAKKKLGNKDMKKRPQNRQQPQGPGGKPHQHFGKRKQQKRLEDPLAQHKNTKRAKFDPNEEIESSSDDDEEFGRKPGNQEDYVHVPTAEELETPQEKKVRLAKLYLEEIEKEERDREENENVDSHLLVSQRLREDILEQEGRLRKEVSEKISPDFNKILVLSCSKHLKKAVTCVCISPDNQFIFSGCKDGNLIKWSVKEKKRVGLVKRKEKLSNRKKKKGITIKPESIDPNSVHASTITSLAISSDGKYLASGDVDKQIVIWNPQTLKRIHIFSGHRGAIRCLVFRKNSHTLYSCSDDRSLRIWSLDEMGYVETLFGHQDSVTSVDALTRERAISSGGRDNSIRVWKIVEESQLVYNGHYNGSIDAVKLVNEENFISCSDDGNLCTWNVNRKKPLFTEPNAHGSDPKLGKPNWISSIAAWNNTDVIASGSCDGLIRFWKCGERFKNLTPVVQVPCEGWINTMEFSHGNEINDKFLVVGIGKEHKLGRWFENVKSAKNSVLIIPLCQPSSTLNIKLTNGNISSGESESDESENEISIEKVSETKIVSKDDDDSESDEGENEISNENVSDSKIVSKDDDDSDSSVNDGSKSDSSDE